MENKEREGGRLSRDKRLEVGGKWVEKEKRTEKLRQWRMEEKDERDIEGRRRRWNRYRE